MNQRSVLRMLLWEKLSKNLICCSNKIKEDDQCVLDPNLQTLQSFAYVFWIGLTESGSKINRTTETSISRTVCHKPQIPKD